MTTTVEKSGIPLTKMPDWIKHNATQEHPVFVSAETYEKVVEEARLPMSYQTPNSTVLSVGEGLSNFTKRLQQKGVRAYALDPIYSLGATLFQHEQPSTVDQSLLNRFGGLVRFNRRWLHTDRKIDLPDPSTVIAGSVYDLPFQNNSFDLIIANRVYQHIDLAAALPELVRVMKPHGEIRISGALLHAQPEQRKLFPLGFTFSDNFRQYQPVSGIRVNEAMEWLGSEQDLSSYTVLNGIPKNDELCEYHGMYSAGILIIRKDDQTPKILPYANEPIRVPTYNPFPYIGSRFRVIPSVSGKHQVFGSYYSLVDTEAA